jgi:hypothetical protein
MSVPADPIDQLGEVLATAERHVQEIVQAAEQRADERVREQRLRLDTRAAELEAIAAELLAASASIHHQVQRLRALPPLPLPEPADADAPGPPVRAVPAPPEPVPSASYASDPPEDEPPEPPVAEHRPATAAVGSPPRGPHPVPEHQPDPEPASAAVRASDHDLPIIGGGDHGDVPPASAEQIDSARLIALSMAAGGRSRAEVEEHLRSELGISDYGPLIDYVFGISTPSSVVPSWPPRRRRRG